MPTTLTPLRYPGGKSKYTGLFADIISMNNLDNCTFVEVFAGGAGAAVSLLLKERVKFLILNDLDIAIHAFWKSVKEYPDALIRLIRSTRVSIAEWRRQKEIYNSKNTSDMLGLGFSTFYLNRCNHSGILGARPIGGMNQNGNYSIKSRYNKTTAIEKIAAIARHADAIEVFNLDAISFLKLLKRKHRNRKCFVYFDPPYYQKGPALYLNHFSHEDHKELRESILNCPFPWLLSYDNHEEILNLYKNQDCSLFLNSLRHTIAGNSNAEELIISKLNLPDHLETFHSRGERGRRWA